MTMKISERKARLAPIIKELRPLRQQCQDLQIEYDDKKHKYDSTALQLQSSMGQLETSVRGLRDEILGAESRYPIIICRTEIIKSTESPQCNTRATSKASKGQW